MAYNFDKKLEHKQFTVEVDTQAKYGYFEHEIHGDGLGGGLWFEIDDEGRLSLTDYDGVYELPKAVFDALLMMGLHVDNSFL